MRDLKDEEMLAQAKQAVARLLAERNDLAARLEAAEACAPSAPNWIDGYLTADSEYTERAEKAEAERDAAVANEAAMREALRASHCEDCRVNGPVRSDQCAYASCVRRREALAAPSPGQALLARLDAAERATREAGVVIHANIEAREEAERQRDIARATGARADDLAVSLRPTMDALRDEVERLKVALEAAQRVTLAEIDARLMAEAEVERLRSRAQDLQRAIETMGTGAKVQQDHYEAEVERLKAEVEVHIDVADRARLNNVPGHLNKEVAKRLLLRVESETLSRACADARVKIAQRETSAAVRGRDTARATVREACGLLRRWREGEGRYGGSIAVSPETKAFLDAHEKEGE